MKQSLYEFEELSDQQHLCPSTFKRLRMVALSLGSILSIARLGSVLPQGCRGNSRDNADVRREADGVPILAG